MESVIFTEVVDIAINFNDFFASAFRLENWRKDISKETYILYISGKENEINIKLGE